jgi:AraC-like DNA-binding protein
MGPALYQPFPMGAPRARAQVWRHTPSFRRPRHFHEEPELNLVVAGSGQFGIGEATLTVHAGDLLWFASGQDHVLLEGASDDFDLFVFAVTPELSSRVLGAESARRALTGALCTRLPEGGLGRLRSLSAANVGVTDVAAIERHVGDLWREAHALRAVSTSLHPLTRRALDALTVEPELGRDDLAARTRSCPSEVSRHFHRDIGLTLTEYRTRIRLLRFIHGVDAGASLTRAAFDAGFGSYSQCHRAFTQTLGHSPRAFFRRDLRSHMAEALASDPPLRRGSPRAP